MLRNVKRWCTDSNVLEFSFTNRTCLGPEKQSEITLQYFSGEICNWYWIHCMLCVLCHGVRYLYPLAGVWTFLSAKKYIFFLNLKILKIMIETWIFYCFVKRACTFLCKTQILAIFQTANFTVFYFYNFFKCPIFPKNLNLRTFQFFFLFRISREPLKIFL